MYCNIMPTSSLFTFFFISVLYTIHALFFSCYSPSFSFTFTL